MVYDHWFLEAWSQPLWILSSIQLIRAKFFQMLGGGGSWWRWVFKASTRQKGKGERKKKGIRKKEVLGFEKL